MKIYARWAASGLAREPGRTLTRVLVLAAAVALLGAMLLFIGHSLRTMTASATRSVPLDWQGPVSSHDGALRNGRAQGSGRPNPGGYGSDPRRPSELPRAHKDLSFPARRAEARGDRAR